MSDPAIRVRDLGKRYRIWSGSSPTTLSDRISRVADRVRHRQHEEHHPARREIWALRNVDFDVAHGEVLGIIGPNGAGKSTLLSILARITEPTEGVAEIDGRVNALLEVGTGFHPELSGRDNVFLNGAILGMSRAETASKFDEIVDFAGVSDFIDVPVKRYSSGMYVRLAFAVAVSLDPEVLLLDEVLAVGDRAFQEKCLTRIHELTRSGRTVLFVSHDPGSVTRLCDRALVINEGRIVFDGEPQAAVERYLSSRTLEGTTAVAERPGTGALRVRHLVVESEDGVITADRPVSVEVQVAAERPVDARQTTLELRVYSAENGFACVSLPFRLDRMISDTLTLRCEIEELPLRPGSYFVLALITAPNELIDQVNRAADFAIVPSDFFGTGVHTETSPIAPLVVRHRWSASGEPATFATSRGR
jgi:lipopolysaccharide transport system ATP-binding protein